MAAGGKFFDNWFGRAANAAGLFQLVPSAVIGGAMAYYSTGVAWLVALGPFGWIVSGLAGFVGTSAALLMVAKMRLANAITRAQKRLHGDGSSFDPMERVYRDKRLYLRDLAPLGRKRVTNKKFINCEIIGPGTIIVGLETDPTRPKSVMRDCNTFDVDCVEIDSSRVSNLATGFWDCDFEGCEFYHITLLFFQRANDTLNWITKPAMVALPGPEAGEGENKT